MTHSSKAVLASRIGHSVGLVSMAILTWGFIFSVM